MVPACCLRVCCCESGLEYCSVVQLVFISRYGIVENRSRNANLSHICVIFLRTLSQYIDEIVNLREERRASMWLSSH